MSTLDELKNNFQLIEDVNNHVPFLWGHFDEIIRFKNRSFTDPDIDDSINVVFQNFVDIISLVPLMAINVDTPQVVRGQKNCKDEPIFSSEKRISYNKSKMNLIEFGRFNQKGEPLFYASLPTESKNVDYVLSCALECCKELTAETRNYKYQDITVGQQIKLNYRILVNENIAEEHGKVYLESKILKQLGFDPEFCTNAYMDYRERLWKSCNNYYWHEEGDFITIMHRTGPFNRNQ